MADDIVHHSHLRMRVTGVGNLDTRLIGLYETSIAVDNPPTSVLAVIPMQTATPRLVQFNANFEQQYTQIEVSVNLIDEFFYITKIVTYVKPVAVAFPM